MKISFEDHDKICIASMAGELNTDSVDALRRGVSDRIQRGTRDFVLILNELAQIDSAGLECLLWVQDCTADRKGQTRLVGVPEVISTILRITRLDRLFDRYDDVTDAVRSLR